MEDLKLTKKQKGLIILGMIGTAVGALACVKIKKHSNYIPDPMESTISALGIFDSLSTVDQSGDGWGYTAFFDSQLEVAIITLEANSSALKEAVGQLNADYQNGLLDKIFTTI